MSEAFAKPDVSADVVTAVKETLATEEKMYPWDVLDAVSEETKTSRTEARKALRGLRLANRVVPAGEFVGRVRLVEE